MIEPKRLVELISQELEKNESVRAFVLVGSQARDDVYKATGHSDLEAYIIVQDGQVKEVESTLPEIIGKHVKLLFWFKHDNGFVAVVDDLFRLELPVIKESGMKGLFSRPRAQVVKPLFDKTDGELEAILLRRPEEIDYGVDFKKRVENFWYWEIIGAQYLKKGEVYNARSIANIQASTLIRMYELYNDPKILLLETNKRVEQFLDKKQLEVIKELTPGYEAREVKKALTKALKVLPEIFLKISEKYSFGYDRTLEAKVGLKIAQLLEE